MSREIPPCYTEYHPTSLEVAAIKYFGDTYVKRLTAIVEKAGPRFRMVLAETAKFHEDIRKVYKDAAREYKKMAQVKDKYAVR